MPNRLSEIDIADPNREKIRVLFITGLSGAGKSTALKTLEDLSWEVVDNFPLRLFSALANMPSSQYLEERSAHPMAVGFDTRTRGFNAERLAARIDRLKEDPRLDVSLIYLNCSDAELERRYNETRRRHPLANDRPTCDGVAEERRLLSNLAERADIVWDSTHFSADDLRKIIREQFGTQTSAHTNLQIFSFGYARGIPHNADLLFDMRFLRNPHWDSALRNKTGLDEDVGAFISQDHAYLEAVQRIYDLLIFLIPRYEADGKAYVNIGFGCTGGKHRSVYITETISKWLQDAGFSPTVSHRDLGAPLLSQMEDRRSDMREKSTYVQSADARDSEARL